MDVKPRKDSSRITLKAIAEDLGVAPSTVSNAYNRPDQLSPALRERVLARARELGYAGPNPTAASLRRGKTGAVGLVFPNSLSYTFTDPIAAAFVRGVAGEVERAGYGLLLIGGFFAEDDAGEQEVGARRETFLAAKANVDGFVLYNLPRGDPLLETALGRKLPTVLVDDPDVEDVPSVIVEDEVGAYRAAEHVLALGHKRLGVISLELDLNARGGLIGSERRKRAAYRPTQTRLQGYAAAVRAAGLSWEEVLVYETEDNSVEQGRKAAAALLARPSDVRPTALLAMSDQLALGALAYATESGVHVPEDLSIVGYDDSVLAARATPPLTTVRQPYVDKGRIAGEMLLARLRGETPTSRSLETELVIRGSSGRARR